MNWIKDNAAAVIAVVVIGATALIGYGYMKSTIDKVDKRLEIIDTRQVEMIQRLSYLEGVSAREFDDE